MRNIKFNSIRIPTITISIVVILIGAWFFTGDLMRLGLKKLLNTDMPNMWIFTPKGFNFGIDFESGASIQTTVYSGIDQEAIRKFAIDSGLGSEVQRIVINETRRIGKADSYLIKIKLTKEDQSKIESDVNMTTWDYLGERINNFFNLIKKAQGSEYELTGDELVKANAVYPDEITGEHKDERSDSIRVLDNVVRESQTLISPSSSKTLQRQAFFLVLFILFVMLAYITIRFKFKYAIGAIFALIHDVLIILGFLALFQIEFNYTIIAAILFIIGYSLNDTIVIFDRVRENYNIMKDYSSKAIVNTSINQSLSRTIITSLTTLLAVLALLFFGGPKIYGFSITLVAGILCGTYSSIFIASPVVDSWEKLFASKSVKIKEAKKEEKMAKQEQEIKENDDSDLSDNNLNKSKSISSISKKQLKKISGKKKK